MASRLRLFPRDSLPDERSLFRRISILQDGRTEEEHAAETQWLDSLLEDLGSDEDNEEGSQQMEDEGQKSADLPLQSREEPEQNVFSLFELPRTKRIRTVSDASMEVQDGQIATVS